jgi:hypothetical protein
MATEISVPSALPIELDFSLPASLPSAKNFEMRLQPVNAQSFTAGQVLQFDLPCGRRGQYMDPATTYLRYKMTYTHSGAATTDKSFLLGSSYSPFIKQEVYGNNSVLLESINEVGVLASMMLNVSLNDADKRGLSPSMGFGYTSFANASATCGHTLFITNNNTGLEGLTFEYCTPIIGILGSGTDKLFPIGAIYGLRFELTMDNFTNYIADYTANLVSGATISEVELVSNIVELGSDSQALIEMQNPEKIHIRSQSYRQASNFIGASTGAGSNDLLVGIRVSSLKSLWMACHVGNAACEKKFAGINPNLDQGTCFVISSQNYPQRTLNPSGHPGDCFMELQKSLGALSMANFNGAISKPAYYTSSTQYGLCQAFNSTIANIATNPNQFFIGVDVEVVARKQSLLSGINVNSSPIIFRAQVGSTLSANQHTCNFFGYYDLILEIDTMQKSIISKF